MKITLDAIIDKMKDRQAKLASEVNVDEVDAPTTDNFEDPLNNLARFIKGQGTGPAGRRDDDQPGTHTGRDHIAVDDQSVIEPDNPNESGNEEMNEMSKTSGTK
jgi:hypothetical protein